MSKEAFKDNFSQQSHIYARYRPRYPKELYAYLTSLTGEHAVAWDCGTGNGQAALDLAAYYRTVIATDPSEQQIRHAVPHEQIDYRVEKAELNTLDTNSVDLVVLANALHWMDFDRFYAEADRVMKDDAVFAAWTYGLPVIDPQIDRIVNHFHYTTIGDYWLPENELIEQEYNTIPFPFLPIAAPGFHLERIMNLDDFIGYISTWSATQRYIRERQSDPTESLQKELQDIWGGGAREMKWKLVLKAGRKQNH